MKIRAGYDIIYECARPTPQLLALSIHPSRVPDLLTPHVIEFEPPVSNRSYVDSFGNRCTRLIAPPGQLRIKVDFTISDSGKPDEVAPDAIQHPVDELPDDVLVF